MNLTGKSLIAGKWLGEESQTVFYAFNPARNEPAQQVFFNASAEQTKLACSAAQQAFLAYRRTSEAQRAAFLCAIADEIAGLGDALLTLTHEETNLPMARLTGERGRTMGQLRAFASHLQNSSAVLLQEQAEPNRQPLPKSAFTLTRLPLGPVAVFGASNFPYAFSTLGGDTAAALAAGCPVVVKGHPAHPGTSELMALAIARAIETCGMPPGVFSLLQTNQVDLAHQLVADPHIQAVGFTGSLAVARHLQRTIAEREQPIPLYAELGSVNPQVLLPEQMAERGEALAEQLCQSLLMGNGQFCTSPGLWLVPEDNAAFAARVEAFLAEQPSDTLLTPGILRTYQSQTQSLAMNSKLKQLGLGSLQQSYHAQAMVFAVSAADFLANPQLQQEVFGPCALMVSYQDQTQLLTLIASLEGQLTASVHGSAGDIAQADEVVEALSYKVGRLIYNQMPTGVEVCAAMNHGGPYPASTDVRSTSVGLQAMQRFLRPLCVQNAS